MSRGKGKKRNRHRETGWRRREIRTAQKQNENQNENENPSSCRSGRAEGFDPASSLFLRSETRLNGETDIETRMVPGKVRQKQILLLLPRCCMHPKQPRSRGSGRERCFFFLFLLFLSLSLSESNPFLSPVMDIVSICSCLFFVSEDTTTTRPG